MTVFTKWLDTLLSEKGTDLDQVLTVPGPKDSIFGDNSMPLQIVIDAIKTASKDEQKSIKKTLVQIDFLNGDICHYFKHLAQALAI